MAKPVHLSAGDFVVLPRSDSHIVRDFPTTPVVDYFEFLKGRASDKQGAFSAGGLGSVMKPVCGGMQSENGSTDPLLSVLPPLIHFKGRGEDAAPGLRVTVSHVFEELSLGLVMGRRRLSHGWPTFCSCRLSAPIWMKILAPPNPDGWLPCWTNRSV